MSEVQASQIPANVRRRRGRRRRRPIDLGQGRQRAVEQHAGERREAARAALEALRPGRRRPVHEQRRKKFTEKYGIEVRVDTEGWEDVRPKAAVAANIGAGPDIILATNDDAHLYPEKLVDVTDVCDLSRARSTAAGIRCASST